MRKITKIVFGVGLAMSCANVLSNNAFAANLDVSNKFNATAKISNVGIFEISANGSTEGVDATDYIEFDIKDLQINYALNGSKVKVGSDEIGAISIKMNEHQFTRVVNKPVDNTVTPSYSDGKIRITFNEKIKKYENASFTISNQNSYDWMETRDGWSAEGAINFSGNKIASKNFTFPKANVDNVTKTCGDTLTIYEDFSLSRTTFNVGLRNDGANPFKAGDKIYLTLLDDKISFVDFSEKEVNSTVHFNYVSSDTPINANGVYFTSTKPEVKVKFVPTGKSNQIIVEVLEDFPARDLVSAAGINNIFKVNDYSTVDDNTKAMNYGLEVRTVRSGADICNLKNNNARIVFNGSSSEISVRKKKEPVVIPKEETPKNIEEKVDKIEEIKAPNTGFENSKLPSIIAGISGLGILTLGAFAGFRKK